MRTPAFVAGLLVGVALLVVIYLLEKYIVSRTRYVRAVRAALVLFFFVTWECQLRLIVALAPYQMYLPDPLTGWRLNPDMTTAQEQYGLVAKAGGRTHLTEQISGTEKSANIYRILFFGDSQAINVANSYIPQLAYPQVAARELQKFADDRHVGLQIEAMNFGVSGFTSWQALQLLRRMGLKYQPDLVVFALGYHDCSMSTATDEEVMVDSPAVFRLRQVLYESQVYLMLHKALRSVERPTDANQQTVRVPLKQYEAVLREVIQLGNEHHFRTVLLTEPVNRVFGDVFSYSIFRAAMRRVTTECKVDEIDAFSAFQAYTLEQEAAQFIDQVHLTVEGHASIAHIIAAALRPYLSKFPGQ